MGILKKGFDAAKKPIAQKLVNQAEVQFKTVKIECLKQDGFTLSIDGSLSKTGPFPATIYFNGLAVKWGISKIATIDLPEVKVKEGGNPNWAPKGEFKITNQSQFAEFVKVLLGQKNFKWDIESSTLCLTAVGLSFDNIKLSKEIKLDSFNGLPGITLQKFELLPGPKGIRIISQARITSDSQLAISLGTVDFRFFLGKSFIGDFSVAGLKLPARGTAEDFQFRGCIDKPEDLDAVGNLVSKFLKGERQTLTVKGVYVNTQPTWLGPALEALSLNVDVEEEKMEVITSIKFLDVAITMDKNPLISSERTLITYQNPFGFSFKIVEAAANVTLGYNGERNVVEVELPNMCVVERGYSDGNPGPVQVAFDKCPLKVLDQNVFQAWRRDVERSQTATVELWGTATVMVDTPVGRVQITDLSINCTSELRGIKWLKK